ncbi:hypothetical protein M3Y94_01265500 [Aphelenchoides besseyi]|nr:hypothetical protein M3Y94_01265500 [Aphelenchoides besseyi]KAI6222585.1 hypothetical protein M3Y95_00909100 [Aphelenchoides besseyi]
MTFNASKVMYMLLFLLLTVIVVNAYYLPDNRRSFYDWGENYAAPSYELDSLRRRLLASNSIKAAMLDAERDRLMNSELVSMDEV